MAVDRSGVAAARRESALVPVKPAEALAFGLRPAEFQALQDAIAKDATPEEFKVHLMICNRLGLSPVGGHVHFVKRWDNQQNRKVFSTQIGIDGYRSLAEDTGEYEGPAGLPQYQYEKGGDWTEDLDVDVVPYAAKVGVYRAGRREPVYAVAYYKHYVQTVTVDGNKRPNAIWNNRGGPQLAKCAEALALRMAFPRKLGGIYTQEEMAQANADIVIDAVAEPVADKPEPPKRVLNDAERKILTGLGNTLPAPADAKGGPTKWAPGKYKARVDETGAFECVLSELVADHVTAYGDSSEHVRTIAGDYRGMIHAGPHTPGHYPPPPSDKGADNNGAKDTADETAPVPAAPDAPEGAPADAPATPTEPAAEPKQGTLV